MINKIKHFFLLAGEPSGDLHGAELINCLKKTNPSAAFSGIGGTKMQKTGLVSLAPINKLAVMGFWEVIKKFGFFIWLEKVVLQHIKTTKPDIIVLIDYPGFNLRIAKKIKQLYKIPIIYYISPQVWAWKEKRTTHIKKYIDELIVIFPFEVEWFKTRGINVQYFGHPLIDQWKNHSFLEKPPLSATKTIGLFPGSRQQEVQKHLPVFLNLIKKCGSVRFVISRSKNLPASLFKDFKKPNIRVVSWPLFDVFEGCDLAIVASGTATLECAVSQTPFIAIYKTSLLSWLITQSVVKLKFASIVNILANKKIVPELLQSDFTLKKVLQNLKLLSDSDYSKTMKKNFVVVVNSLGDGFSYQKTANYIAAIKRC